MELHRTGQHTEMLVSFKSAGGNCYRSWRGKGFVKLFSDYA